MFDNLESMTRDINKGGEEKETDNNVVAEEKLRLKKDKDSVTGGLSTAHQPKPFKIAKKKETPLKESPSKE